MINPSYRKLLDYLRDTCLGTLLLTFDEIYSISGIRVDSGFMARRVDIERNGFSVVKINLNNETVLFSRKAR